jgi:diacylglycerol kinase family enzyme
MTQRGRTPLASPSRIPREADRVVVLMNPKAGPRAAQPLVDGLATGLRRRGYKTEVLTDLAAATSLANQWYQDGSLRALVVAGGDGTAAAAVNGTVEGVPIALAPAGNSNLLARYLGLSRCPEAICDTICHGVTIRLDAGMANSRIFLLMAGCGFDAEVVRRVHQRRTGHVGNGTYIKPILESIWNYSYPEIRVHWDHGDGAAAAESSARWWFAFNLPCYAGNLMIAPRADGSDGLLDVYGLRRGGTVAGVWYLASILARRHHRLPDCTIQRASRLLVTSEEEVPYQLDGDPGGVLPLDLRVLPGRLTLVVPPHPPNP